MLKTLMCIVGSAGLMTIQAYLLNLVFLSFQNQYKLILQYRCSNCIAENIDTDSETERGRWHVLDTCLESVTFLGMMDRVCIDRLTVKEGFNLVSLMSGFFVFTSWWWCMCILLLLHLLLFKATTNDHSFILIFALQVTLSRLSLISHPLDIKKTNNTQASLIC